jgi:hypothetical protein
MAWRLAQCTHEVGLSQEGARVSRGPRLDTSASALGKAAHKVLEAALVEAPLSGEIPPEWFEARWRSEVEEAQQSCLDQTSPERWKRYSIVKRGTRAAIKQIRAEAAAAGARPIVETEMWSADRDLWGRPDVVLAFADGTAELIDFKTGTHDGAAPSTKELHQLDFYTVLVEEFERLEVVSVRILRCDGPSWRGPARPAASAAVAAGARRAMGVFNMRLSDTASLANPGEPCTYCRQALGCKPVWDSRPPQFTAVGGRVETSSDEAGATTLEVSVHETRVVVTGCPPGVPAVGQTAMIAHVRAMGDTGFRWQPERSMMRWF